MPFPTLITLPAGAPGETVRLAIAVEVLEAIELRSESARLSVRPAMLAPGWHAVLLECLPSAHPLETQIVIRSALSGAETVVQVRAADGRRQASAASTPHGTVGGTPNRSRKLAEKQYSAPPAMVIDPAKKYSASIETSAGTLVADLYPADAPLTVNNFVFLAREGFYDDVIFHRVIDGFMIQGGDPTGTGTGGPGYRFKDEPVSRKYLRGTLAMANAGPNTNGSQFFVMHADYGLPPNYTIFGKLTSGEDVVDTIAKAPRNRNDRPNEPVSIKSVTITES
jgi:cyclophilin family peptidyl-prolyl cis-trans isomerase